MWHEHKLATAETFVLATAGAIQGIWKYYIRDRIMELRLNNQSIETDDLSDQAREDLARTIAFNRDAAIGQLAVLGYPADHPYEPKVIEETPKEVRLQLSLDNHRGFGLGH